MMGELRPPAIDVSIVVPLYRNAGTVAELAQRVRAALEPSAPSWELLLVVDACPAGSLEAAREVANQDRAAVVIELGCNVGQHRAVLIGLAEARGDWMIVLDGDLQDPPEAVAALLASRHPGAEAVFAARRGRYQGWTRHLTSKAFKLALALLAGVPRDAGIFVAISRRMCDRIQGLDGQRPSVVAMIGLSGLPFTSVPVRRACRPTGRSAYRGTARLEAGIGALVFTLGHRLGWRQDARTDIHHLVRPRCASGTEGTRQTR